MHTKTMQNLPPPPSNDQEQHQSQIKHWLWLCALKRAHLTDPLNLPVSCHSCPLHHLLMGTMCCCTLALLVIGKEPMRDLQQLGVGTESGSELADHSRIAVIAVAAQSYPTMSLLCWLLCVANGNMDMCWLSRPVLGQGKFVPAWTGNTGVGESGKGMELRHFWV